MALPKQTQKKWPKLITRGTIFGETENVVYIYIFF
jgi:hypothetical protein